MPTAITLCLVTDSGSPLVEDASPAHGWFLSLLRRADPAWSDSLHRPNQPRPFTLSPLYRPGGGPLWERRATGGVRPGELWLLRVALLDDARAAWLRDMLQEESLELPPLGRARVRLARPPESLPEDSDVESVPWRSLAESEPASALRLHFLTPTAFVSQSETLPRAEPERLWGSWRRSWDRYAPEPLADVELLNESLPLLRRYDLSTRDVSIKGNLFVGFVGWMELAWRVGAPEEMRRAAHALARLSVFAGTGAKTAQGMGLTAVEAL